MDIRKELGVNSIKEKVRETRLRWYGHMQRMEENNEVRAFVDMIVPGKRPRGRPRGSWIAFEGTSRNCGSPRRMPRTEHSGKPRIRVTSWEKANKKKTLTVLDAMLIYLICIGLPNVPMADFF